MPSRDDVVMCLRQHMHSSACSPWKGPLHLPQGHSVRPWHWDPWVGAPCTQVRWDTTQPCGHSSACPQGITKYGVEVSGWLAARRGPSPGSVAPVARGPQGSMWPQQFVGLAGRLLCACLLSAARQPAAPLSYQALVPASCPQPHPPVRPVGSADTLGGGKACQGGHWDACPASVLCRQHEATWPVIRRGLPSPMVFCRSSAVRTLQRLPRGCRAGEARVAQIICRSGACSVVPWVLRSVLLRQVLARKMPVCHQLGTRLTGTPPGGPDSTAQAAPVAAQTASGHTIRPGAAPDGMEVTC